MRLYCLFERCEVLAADEDSDFVFEVDVLIIIVMNIINPELFTLPAIESGDLSSDAGRLLLKEFISKMGFDRLLSQSFQANDAASFRYHTDDDNLLQIIYQIFSAYFTDDCADELTNEPVFTTILGKPALASQPTLSRFNNRMDIDTFRIIKGLFTYQ